ncbi:MAG: type II secretion system F family protein [Clostridiales bacterium]|nr:type II secretion system F family protein [Clostridiales bacterium]
MKKKRLKTNKRCRKNMLKSHKKSVLILGVSVLLAAGIGMRDQAEMGEMLGIAERGEEGGDARSQTFSFRLQRSEEDGGNTDGQEQTDEEELEMELEIAAVQRSREESLELLEQAVTEWEDGYLGDNSSANEVRQDLNLVSELCEGMVQVSYESSDSTILQTDGTVTAKSMTDSEETDGESGETAATEEGESEETVAAEAGENEETVAAEEGENEETAAAEEGENEETAASEDGGEEGTLVELTVEFSCGDYVRIETYGLRILPPEEGSREWILNELLREAQEAEQSSREESQFSLPDTVAGYHVVWTGEQEYRWLFFLLIGAAAAFCLEQKDRQDEKERQRKRKEQLLFEYPQMVDQIAVLLDSGMTIRKAWERIAGREYPGQRKRGKKDENAGVYLEEMQITCREIREGRGEREAYERFGRRIGLAPYKRFSSILTQNLSKGTGDIRRILQKESEDALDMRRSRARKLGEEAGTKLLFPMLVMLVLILAVLLLPALGNL